MEKKKILKKSRVNEKKVKKLGGLFILGTERHESRRIDNHEEDLEDKETPAQFFL